MQRTLSDHQFIRDIHEIDTCVFDYGGVVSFHYCEPWQSNIGKILGLSTEQADALLSENSVQGRNYRLGLISREEFWSMVFEKARLPTANILELEHNWANSYQIDQRMLDIIQQLRNERKYKIGILSNCDKYRHAHIENTYGLSQKVDYIISSHQYGIIKPEKAAYLKTLEITGRSEVPEKVLYVDDRAGHVATATTLGLQGYVFSTYEQFFKLLKDYSILA